MRAANREAPLDDTLHIALLNPEIPQNTGNIGRLCLGLELTLHLVHPLGFSTDTKAVRRAGLDYWKHVAVQEHADAAAFFDWVGARRVLAFSSHSRTPYTQAPFAPGVVLLFVRESVGLPPEIRQAHDAYTIPMSGETRSLNLSNAVAVIAYQAMQSVRPSLFSLPEGA